MILLTLHLSNMIYSREYKPKGNQLIYHYCSAETFHAICSHKTIRLCDIHSMNDYLEMHYGYQIWEKAAGQLLAEFGHDFIDAIDKVFHHSGFHGLLVASCFSLDGDVLSQWRGYADDGKGYVIGFKASEIKNLPIRLLKVEYRENRQIEELKRVIRALHDVEIQNEEKFSDDFINACAVIAYDLAAFKNSAFSEEKEVRATHVLNLDRSNNFLKLTDAGGSSFGEPIKGEPVRFMIAQNMPKAYIDINFTNAGKVNPIKQVIIGPKNDVMQSAISIYLETMGIGKVKVLKSKATYR